MVIQTALKQAGKLRTAKHHPKKIKLQIRLIENTKKYKIRLGFGAVFQAA